MPLVACLECKHEISTDATACPHCGKTDPGKPWRVSVNRVVYPSTGLDEIAHWVAEGRVGPKDYIFAPGYTNWICAGEHPELASIFSDRNPWMISRGGVAVPIGDLDEVREWIKDGNLRAQDWVRRPGTFGWVLGFQDPALREYLPKPWSVSIGGVLHPLTGIEELQYWVKQGKLHRDDLVLEPGETRWVPVLKHLQLPLNFRNVHFKRRAALIFVAFLAVVVILRYFREREWASDREAKAASMAQQVSYTSSSAYQKGYRRGLQDGRAQADAGWEMPTPMGLNIITGAYLHEADPLNQEEWKRGFKAGFLEGFVAERKR